MSVRSILLTAAVTCLITSSAALACSRVVYTGPDGMVVTGRSMDWMVSLHTNLWSFPEGIKRNGADGANSLTWTSKYGSVVATAYDAAPADGMNEKGLVANILYLSSTEYEARDPKRLGMSLAAWAQYVLDSYATVDEAVMGLTNATFQILPPVLPGGFAPTMHLSISDPSGDSAVLEFIGGKLIVHHSKGYAVMTNEPPYDQQLALNAYWKDVGGSVMLPGTERAADRFVRASYYLGQSPQTKPGAPNIAPTLWRTVSDQKDHVYYYESSTMPNVFWVDMSKLDLAAGSPMKRLDVDSGKFYAGETSADFKPASNFEFMPAVQ
jgi:penicillin V acylase-like amidase (Ntn superfamily)